MNSNENIMNDILSQSPFRIIQGIIHGTREKVTDNAFISRLKENAENNKEILHVPVSSFALAALHLLGIEEYSGDDENILKMIENKMEF